MTREYKIRFIDSEAQYSETATAQWDTDTSICDFLEEQLYILWELRPLEREWRRQFCTNGWTRFIYGLYEQFSVSYAWDNSNIITVEKIQA